MNNLSLWRNRPWVIEKGSHAPFHIAFERHNFLLKKRTLIFSMKKIHDRFLGRFCRSQSHKKGKEKIFFWAMTWVFERGRGNSIYLLPSNIDSLHLRVFFLILYLAIWWMRVKANRLICYGRETLTWWKYHLIIWRRRRTFNWTRDPHSPSVQ